MGTIQNEFIGLIPAGGQAKRISPLPCSKELYPVGFQHDKNGLRPKVVCHYLLEKMHHAGVDKAFFVLRNGKWDIPSYFGDGTMLNMHISYLIMGLPYGVPFTLDQAYPFLKSANIVFGFPDIVFQTESAFSQLIERHKSSNADIILGLFPTDEPQKKDMVAVDEQGLVFRMDIKPQQTVLLYTWCIAVWNLIFTDFMHTYLTGMLSGMNQVNELTMGDVIQAAMRNNLRVEGVIFRNDTCLDIGTPGDLIKAYSSMGVKD